MCLIIATRARPSSVVVLLLLLARVQFRPIALSGVRHVI